MSIVPPSARIRVIATSIPTPRPEMLVTAAAVVKPGRASTRSNWSSLSVSTCASNRPSAFALARMRAIDAAAVVGDADRHAGPLAQRRQHDLPLGLLPRAPPLG